MTISAIANPGTPIINSQGSLIVKQTLAQHTVASVNSRLTGKTPSTSIPVFSTNTGFGNSSYLYGDGSGIQYTRNASLWCADIVQQLTAIAAWNNVWAKGFPDAHLITPRHAITVAHFPAGTGWKYHFVDINNNVYIRTVQAVVSSPSYIANNFGYDYQVMVFDQDLPSTINHFPVAGSDFSHLLYLADYQNPMAIVVRDQNNNMAVRDFYGVGTLAPSTDPLSGLNYHLSNDNLRAQFFKQIVPGDSGDPVGIIVNNQFVLITCNTYGFFATGYTDATNTGGGWNYSHDLANINSLIAAVDAAAGISTGYQATVFDLSSFPQY
jgi:hypothetical protein